MKKGLKMLAIMLTTFMSVTYVKADTTQLTVPNKTFEDFYNIEINYNNETIKLYDYFMNIFNNQNEYQYYTIDFYDYNDTYFYNIHFSMYNTFSYESTANLNRIYITSNSDSLVYGWSVTNGLYGPWTNSHGAGNFNFTIASGLYGYIDSNINIISTGNNYEITGLYNSTIKINSNDIIPTLKQLSNEEIRNVYINGEANYTTVNLDDYHYVILNLKDYNKKEAFETNMKVKGSIGITPVYEFGTAEKTEITDICNISYSDFTDYRFFVLKNDLINNSIYYVKGCESGSSFKFDSTIFDITYVTDENVDDPVITFGGIDYHTISFDKLSNTVNKNTEDGFIPGESEKFDPIGTATDYISSFWNSLSTFMSLVTKFFNTLPIEIRAISITMFITACTLGLIKILKS